MSINGVYHATSDYLTVVDNDNVTVYDTFFNVQYENSKPELKTGLGITGKVQDAVLIANSSGVFVFIKINNKWKLVRTSITKSYEGKYSETSLMNYNFVKPIDYNTSGMAWGIHKSTSVDTLTITTAGTGYVGNGTLSAVVDAGSGGSGFSGTYTVTNGAVTAVAVTIAGSYYTSVPTIVLTPASGTAGSGAVITPASTEGYNIHTAIPFYESDLRNSWVYYANGDNSKSAWGQVTKSRAGLAKADGSMPRYLSVDWKYDSEVYDSNGVVIGLNHESGKMLGENNEFIWFLLDAPLSLHDGSTGQAKEIEDPKIQIEFSSRVIRDVVFFKAAETSLPAQGSVGAPNRIAFLNYKDATQHFYVLNIKAF